MLPLCVCLYGETCSGKSTLGKGLSLSLGCRYISFGDLKREEIKRKTKVGLEIQELLKQNCPLPAELGYAVIKNLIRDGSLNVISGYPISVDELKIISTNLLVIGMIVLGVDEQTLITRFGMRRECSLCHLPGIIGDLCPIHNIQMIKREDMSIENLLERRKLYNQRIEPFLKSRDVQFVPRLVLDSSFLTRRKIIDQVEGWIRPILGNYRR